MEKLAVLNIELDDKSEIMFSGEERVNLFKNVLAKGTSLRFKALGFSMLPFIRNGDTLTISKLTHERIRLGDIVAFINSRAGRLFVHRIVAKRSTGYLIKGDNLLRPDGIIPQENILGAVTKIESNGKETLFGLGFERSLIALASHLSLFSLAFYAYKVLRSPFMKFKHGQAVSKTN